jgi:hypothetical protein
LCDSFFVKNQSQRDLQRHWAEQSKKLTPAERLAAKAEKLRKQIERDKAFLERRKQESQSPTLQPAAQTAGSTKQEAKLGNPKSAGYGRRRAKE